MNLFLIFLLLSAFTVFVIKGKIKYKDIWLRRLIYFNRTVCLSAESRVSKLKNNLPPTRFCLGLRI